ncbi:MAG: 2OG-Fe(II) oxygenase, partial [Myxococcaceae bacterium]
MLVYEPGQFFVSHQDSEKIDGMIGSLVVTLPSSFKGGAIVVDHHDERVTYRGGSGEALAFIAFYADCHHEVRPVKDGYRVVLTYNLLLEGSSIAISSPSVSKQTETLAQHIRSHFETSPPPRWQNQPPREPPDRLVYLLDHQYTEWGLGGSRRKNGVAARGAAVRAVAGRLDCVIVL